MNLDLKKETKKRTWIIKIESSGLFTEEIEEELKSKIKELEDKEDEFVMKMKEVDAKNEVLRKRKEEMTKAVG